MLDPNIPWLSQGYKKFEREDFFHNDVRNHNRPNSSSVHSQRTRQQNRRVKSATQRRTTTPVNFQSSTRPKSAQPPANPIYRHEKVGCYDYRPESRNSTSTPLRHRRAQSARLASRSSDPENIRNSPVYRKYFEELESIESMEKDDCSYCPVDCRPLSSSSFRPTSSTGLFATLLPSHFERYVFWTRPRTAPPTRRECFQLPRHNNVRRGHVPHYTNFVTSINLSERDSTPSPPLHPRKAFEEVPQSRRDLRRGTQKNRKPVEQPIKIESEVRNGDERDGEEEELLKFVEDDVVVHDLTPELIEGRLDQSTEPHAPTPTPLSSPPPPEETQQQREPTPPPLESPPPKEEPRVVTPLPEQALPEQTPPDLSASPLLSQPQEEVAEHPGGRSPVVERVPMPPLTKKEVKFQDPLVQEHHFGDLGTTEGTDSPRSEVPTEEKDDEESDAAENKEMDEKSDDEGTQIEERDIAGETPEPDSVGSGAEDASGNQTNPEKDGGPKRRTLGPPPKYKVDILGLDSQDLLDIEMRLRRRGTEPSPDVPDVTDIDIKKPKMQSWLRGRLALSRQSSRFEIPMDVRVLESMTPMDYLIGYCRINKRRQALYKKAFRKVDRDNDGVINLKEMEKALGDIFVDSIEAEQIQTLLELIKVDKSVKLRSKMFCAISALTERLLYQQLTTEESAELLNHKKERIEDADFSALDWKLEGSKIQPELRKLLYQL